MWQQVRNRHKHTLTLLFHSLTVSLQLGDVCDFFGIYRIPYLQKCPHQHQCFGWSDEPSGYRQYQMAYNHPNESTNTLTISASELINAGSLYVVGFPITRTTANSGSVSNITVNVGDDSINSYDINRLKMHALFPVGK